MRTCQEHQEPQFYAVLAVSDLDSMHLKSTNHFQLESYHYLNSALSY